MRFLHLFKVDPFNISEGGIGFIANKPLMPGTQIIAGFF